jgi:hypothetical protein
MRKELDGFLTEAENQLEQGSTLRNTDEYADGIFMEWAQKIIETDGDEATDTECLEWLGDLLALRNRINRGER